MAMLKRTVVHLRDNFKTLLIILLVSVCFGKIESRVYEATTSPSTVSPTSSPVIQLDLNAPTIISLDTDEVVRVVVSANVHYVLFQAHSQVHQIQLSYSNPLAGKLQHGDYVIGRDVGLVVTLEASAITAFVYLKRIRSASIPMANSSRIVLLAQTFRDNDPIPGGCNLEFDVEIAPYMEVDYDPYKTKVTFQRASKAFPRGVFQDNCEKLQMSFTYDFYLLYLRERNLSEQEYISSIETMSSLDTIMSKAQKIKPLFGLSRTVFEVVTYRRQGVAFVVVVRSGSGNDSRAVAYVPIVSYGCHLVGDVDSCVDILSPFEWILAILAAVGGIVLCFAGHRLFKVAMFTFGFTTVAFIAYILLARFASVGYTELVSTTFVLGFVGGLLWVTFWWFMGMPIVSVLLPALNLGILIASIVFFTPVGFYPLFENDANYWVLFTCIVLLVPVLLLSFARKLNILCCSVIGSYAGVVLLDRYAGGCLTYIVLNVVRRAIVPQYNHVINPVPFQTNDIFLSCLWGGLAIAGTVFQLWREKDQPTFVLSPVVARRALLRGSYGRSAAFLGHDTSLQTQEYDAPFVAQAVDQVEDERQPLLRQPVRSYRNQIPRPPLPYS